MKLNIGSLTLIITTKPVVAQEHIVIVDRPIIVQKPHIVEESVDLRVPIVRRVEIPVEMPHYVLTPVDHQVIVHRHHISEKPYTIEVERPVVKQVEKEVVVERLEIKEQAVIVPQYNIELGEPQKVEVPLDGTQAVKIKCPCGHVYTSNQTKCVKCGRKTVDTLKGA